jgi:hypothetical protein
MSTPLLGSLLAATAWSTIAVLSLIPSGNAFFARKFAFPLVTLPGFALTAFGLSQGMILAAGGDQQRASGDVPGIFLPAPDSGAQPGMKVK